LALTNGELGISEEIMRRHGNMSSVTVLYILEKIMTSGFKPGAYGLLTALGPGFSSQSLLLRG